MLLRKLAFWLSKHGLVVALRRLDSVIAAALLAWRIREAGINTEVVLVGEDSVNGVALGHVLLVDLHPFLGFSLAAPCILVTTLFGLCGVYMLPGLQALYEPRPKPSSTVELVMRSLGVNAPDELAYLASLRRSELRISDYYEIVEKAVCEGPGACVELLRKKLSSTSE